MAATEHEAAVGPEPRASSFGADVPAFGDAVPPFGRTADVPDQARYQGDYQGDYQGRYQGHHQGREQGREQDWEQDPEPDRQAEPAVLSRGGGRRAAADAKSARKRRRIPAWLEILGYVVVSLTLTSLIKTFLVQMYYIPSSSMEPTTYKGDRVFVDKVSTWVGGAPTRGQVIVFHDPHHWMPQSTGSTGGLSLPDLLATVGILPDQHDDLLIKRIIGVEGDTIECKSADGPVFRNGVALDESSYIMNGKNGRPCFNGVYKVTIPKGNLWVLGDNREHSGDSSYNFLKKGGGDAGYVPTGNVVGHVVGVVSWLRDDHPADS
ncbi:MAG: signal peptidase I [Catenulispora sp.]